MNNKEVAAWLDEQWEVIRASEIADTLNETDRFIQSSVVGIRYAVLTQLLGKMADDSRDLLCLQKGSSSAQGASRRWDPRSFSRSVVVPWVQKNQSVLGTSAEPYATKPLRRPRLDDTTAVRNKAEWDALTEFLKEIEKSRDPDRVEGMVKACLNSAAKLLQKSAVTYPVIKRMSLEQLCTAIEEYLRSPSSGLRPLVLVTAAMRVIGRVFSLYERVESQGLNEPDSAKGVPGDVMCYGANDEMRIAIEVKDRLITLIDFDNTLEKARNTEIPIILFASPGIAEQDVDEIASKIESEWSRGTDIHHTSVESLVRNSFSIIEESWRIEFIKEIGAELDHRGAFYDHRKAWADVLHTP